MATNGEKVRSNRTTKAAPAPKSGAAAPARKKPRQLAQIDGTTRVVGILGDPIDHTLSPRMHNAAFRELELDYVYVPFRADPRRLRDAVRAIGWLGLVGFNVTVPYKEKVLRWMDRTTETAAAVGAVNTIHMDSKGRLLGDNTDVEGFLQALRSHDFRPRRKRVLVIGAGGSSRAVIYGLLNAGATDVVIANRTVSKAKKLARQFGGRGGKARGTDLEILDDIDFLSSRQLVVNCTPVGLKGSEFLDYAVEATPPECVHFDLAYGEKLTPFLEAAKKAKRPLIDGRHMLAHQGAAAFKLFTGRKAPIDVMLRAIGVAS
ncbi:MAG: shikimate dehydrogenase [Hyphomicrobiaceae bacterium]|jgi:shikimate dehydrogenase